MYDYFFRITLYNTFSIKSKDFHSHSEDSHLHLRFHDLLEHSLFMSLLRSRLPVLLFMSLYFKFNKSYACNWEFLAYHSKMVLDVLYVDAAKFAVMLLSSIKPVGHRSLPLIFLLINTVTTGKCLNYGRTKSNDRNCSDIVLLDSHIRLLRFLVLTCFSPSNNSSYHFEFSSPFSLVPLFLSCSTLPLIVVHIASS